MSIPGYFQMLTLARVQEVRGKDFEIMPATNNNNSKEGDSKVETFVVGFTNLAKSTLFVAVVSYLG